MSILLQWFWHLLPANPVAVRIVQGGSRRMQHLWVRMAYLGALIGLVLIGLLSGGGLGQNISLTDLAKAGAAVFQVISFGQIILVCLLAPLFMAAAIGQERAGETLDILLTTPLTNLQIVLGSLVGRLFFVLALLLSGLPLFAVLLIFGGVPVSSVFVSFAVAGLTALVVGSAAVSLSVFRIGGRKAIFAFVISIAAYLVAAYVLDVFLFRRLTPTGHSTTFLTPLHPLLVLESFLASATYPTPAAETLADHAALARFYLARPFAAFATLSTLGSALLLLASAIALRHVSQTEGHLRAWFRQTLRLDHAADHQRPPRTVWANPIAWREANTRGNGAAGLLARWVFAMIGLIAGFTLLVLYHFDTLPHLPNATGAIMPPHEVFHVALVTLLLLEVAIVTLVAIYMSAGCVSREREDQTLDLVLTTPITPKQYIWGKLRGLVSFLSLLIAVPVLTVAMVSIYSIVGHSLQWEQATYVFSAFSGSANRITRQPPLMLPESAVLLLVILLPFVAMCVMAGMSWSLKAKGVLGAVVPTVAIIGALSLVMGLCGFQAAAKIPVIGPIINAFSPATSVLMIINPWTFVAGFPDQPIFGRILLAISALAAAGGYILVVYALLLGMVKSFDHTVRRLSGAG
jgi:ABC-type transport system involved in multi-copper enzyme maturation permease subunit